MSGTNLLLLLLCGATLLTFYRLQTGKRALIVYNYYPRADDSEYTNNFLYFVREGIISNDGNDYVVVVQLDYGQPAPQLPPLPSHARYITHPNECFDLGTIGWLLKNHISIRRYAYFVFLNSSVRGPFLPGWADRIHWVGELTRLFKGRVKMVGSTINCGRAFDSPPIPHVQTYAFAVDYKGLRVLMEAGVFQCFRDWQHAIVEGEIAAARAIFDAGYTIDSLMLRYQGVDWSDPEMNGCNDGMQPIQDGQYDGISVHPLEVMFMKVKSGMLHANWASAHAAVRYDTWAQEAHLPQRQRAPLLRTNHFKTDAPQRLAHLKRSAPCFDADFYIQNSYHDLKVLLNAPNVQQAAWEHFEAHGFLEGRTYRFNC